MDMKRHESLNRPEALPYCLGRNLQLEGKGVCSAPQNLAETQLMRSCPLSRIRNSRTVRLGIPVKGRREDIPSTTIELSWVKASIFLNGESRLSRTGKCSICRGLIYVGQIRRLS